MRQSFIFIVVLVFITSLTFVIVKEEVTAQVAATPEQAVHADARIAQCSDDLDNDHDGRIDLNDSGCADSSDDDESDR